MMQLPPSVLLFLFQLFQFKLTLFLCFPLFPAHSFTFDFHLLLLQFQCLLRFCPDSGILNLFPHLTLYPFRIVSRLLCL